MKSLTLAILVVAFSLSTTPIFADDTTNATQNATKPAPTKISYKEAKAECLKTDSNLQGKALKKCVHSKRSVASKQKAS